MTSPGFRPQLDTLIDRNLAVLLGSPGSLVVILVQPPLIGYLIGLAWQSAEASETTYFILSLAAIYLGCMNACTAIVKERAIYDRERMIGLRLWSYIVSKLQILSLISLVQCLLVLLVAAQWVSFHSGLLRHAILLGILTVTSITASGLGLAISAFARTAYMAVIITPLVVLPQIIFSKVVLATRFDNPALSTIGNCTITKWSYDSMIAVTMEWSWMKLLGSQAVLAVMLGGFMLLCAAKLKLDEV